MLAKHRWSAMSTRLYPGQQLIDCRLQQGTGTYRIVLDCDLQGRWLIGVELLLHLLLSLGPRVSAQGTGIDAKPTAIGALPSRDHFHSDLNRAGRWLARPRQRRDPAHDVHLAIS